MKLKHLIAGIALSAAICAGSLVGAASASAAMHNSAQSDGLTSGQNAVLYTIARQTWRFFDAGTDPNTHLPMDNLGLYGAPNGPYTSPTDIGVYFWSVVAARDLGFIGYSGALQRAHALASNANCCPYDETAVTPRASFLALTVDPRDAFANIQTLRSRYKVYDRYGFFDAVNPTTGQVGHRYLELDQSMIMAALDDALLGNAMQRHFAPDPVIAAAQPYLSGESFSIP